MTPINIYLHLAPRRRPTSSTMTVSPRTSARAELSEAYALSERNRPVSFPPPVTTTNRHQYPDFITPVATIPQPAPNQTPASSIQPLDENAVRAWIDRYTSFFFLLQLHELKKLNISVCRAKSALDLFGVLWFIIGNYMIFSSTTCSDTAQPLYYISLAFIVYGYLILCVPILLCTSVIFCLPCVLGG